MRTTILVLVMLAAGCGGDDDSKETQRQAAVQKCETLKTVWCSKITYCDPSVSMQQCQQIVTTAIDCGKTLSVSSAYDRCIQELSSESCAVFLGPSTSGGLPASCMHVFTK